MSPVAPSLQTEEVHDQAAGIFQNHRQAIYRRTDRMFAGLMALQWIGAVAAACWLSPRTWAGPTSQVHPHVWAALFLGGLISVFPIALALALPGRILTRQVIAVAQLLMSSLLIHVTGGRVETHFHVFGSLAFLAFYRDWRVLLTATLVTALDHLLRGSFWPQSIYGAASASLWRTAEHAGWVAFEDTFLLISCRQSIREMKEISLRQAQMQVAEGFLMRSHDDLERRVEERTASLDRMRRQNELLLNSAGEGIFGLDLEGCTTFINPAAARMIGWDPAEVIGKSMHDLLHHTHPDGSPFPRQTCPIYASIQGGTIYHGREEVFWRKDGTAFDVEYISTPLWENGGRAGAVVTFQDITGRKRAEQEIHHLHAELIMAYDETLNAYDATIEGLSRALDYRDRETQGHSERVTQLAMELSRAMGLGAEELVHVRRGALLHDIGKMAVPDSILHKPGPLTQEEREVMCRHTEYAREMLWPITFLRPALDIPYCHHEKWDGTGYPQGLQREEIPLAARIFAIIDVWDALCSDRPYRKAWNRERVLDHIRGLTGTHFDPRVVGAFMALIAETDEQPVLALAA